jgi:hypothetical protein
MADDGKRTETLCVKVTERMALDLLRLATSQERSTSDFLYIALRQRLYGDIVRLEDALTRFTSSDKVNQAAE